MLFTSLAGAQTVESFTLSPSRNVDGLFVDATGALFASGTFSGTDVFAITDDGNTDVFATGLNGPIQMTRSAVNGNYYVTNFNAGSVSEVTPSGDVRAFASVKPGPSGIVSDEDGNLYISHYGVGNGTGNSITKITPDGTVSDFASGGTINVPVAIAIDGEGMIYTANLIDGRITKITPEGDQSLFSEVAMANPFAIGHLVWANGMLYGTHIGEHRLYAFDADGNASVLAGTGEMGQDDGPANRATFSSPNGLAASVTGDTLYVAQTFAQTQAIRLVILATATSIDKERPYHGTKVVSSYPNPSSSQFTLEFELNQASFTQLDVYNVRGQLITTLVRQTMPPGVHYVKWNAANAAPGVYFYRLRANYSMDTGKMVRLDAHTP